MDLGMIGEYAPISPWFIALGTAGMAIIYVTDRIQKLQILLDKQLTSEYKDDTVGCKCGRRRE